MLKCNAAFEGGGVRGIGHVGAASAIENAGYQFQNLAGSSAGAIVASLLAAGYKGEEIREEMKNLDYMKFKGKDFLDYFGTIGKLLSICFKYGIYSADYFEQWLNGLLMKKGKTIFGDIKNLNQTSEKCRYKLQVTASDLTDKKLLILPGDLKLLGIDPDSFSIAKAVRMSMSIPIFYEPFQLTDAKGRLHNIVDGGLLSNYPVWMLDDGTNGLEYPIFGFKFIDQIDNVSCKEPTLVKICVVEYIKSIVSTALDAYDNKYISSTKGDYQRTIMIPTAIKTKNKIKCISTTDFGIQEEESTALYQNGVNSANEFLKHWNFDSWIKRYRPSNGNR